MAGNVFPAGHAVNGQWHETGGDLQKNRPAAFTNRTGNALTGWAGFSAPW
jgi:hypothetical protein